MSEVEKSVAEQLKDLLDAAVAEKAGKEDLEGLVKEEALEEKADKADLEGVVKSEQLEEVKSESAAAISEAVEAAKAEVREEMEAKMAAAPAVQITKTAPGMFNTPYEKSLGEDGTESNRLELNLTKTFANAVDNADVQGGRVDANAPFYTLEQFNPFREHVTVMNVSGGILKLPNVGGISFAAEDTGIFDSSDKFEPRANGGSLASENVTISNWVSQNAFSKPAMEDVPGMREQIARLIVQAYSVEQAKDMASVLKAASGYTSVAADISDGDVAAGDDWSGTRTILRLNDMITSLDVAYRSGGMFMVSPEVWGALSVQTANTSSQFVYDAAGGVTRLFGYPVIVNGYLDGGGTAADLSVWFGDFRRGAVLAERRSLMIDEYPQHQPGYNTYYADGRFKSAKWDTGALVKLVTQA